MSADGALVANKKIVCKRSWWDSFYHYFHWLFLALENELDANRRKVQGIINESHRKDRELSRLRGDLEKVNQKHDFIAS